MKDVQGIEALEMVGFVILIIIIYVNQFHVDFFFLMPITVTMYFPVMQT